MKLESWGLILCLGSTMICFVHLYVVLNVFLLWHLLFLLDVKYTSSIVQYGTC